MKSSIELIRLLAVILITFTHTRNNFESGVTYIIFEQLPTFGTSILSIVSGYLYYNVTKNKDNLFFKKIKSLAIPYLIANLSILGIVLIVNIIFGYNPLNRLSYDSSLILEGVLSLNSPPINPPTYFIRDIFVIFSIIALITQKEYKTLIVLLPLVFFGTLILRLDVAFLFMLGIFYAKYLNEINKRNLIVSILILSLCIGIWFIDYLKFPISFLLFILIIDLQFKFFNTGRYSYLLHLYHSPIFVITYPIISNFTNNVLVNVIIQILIALVSIYILFLATKRFRFLKVLSGGR